MRQNVFTRLIWFFLLCCAVFILLVVMQFPRRGSFSLKFGDMTVSGRYMLSDDNEVITDKSSNKKMLDGGVILFYGGLEFRITHDPSTDKEDMNFFLVGMESSEKLPVFPAFIAELEDGVVITLSEGTELSFKVKNIGMAAGSAEELEIRGNLAENISAVNIPFVLQRSSLIRESRNILNISYNNNRYQFNQQLQGLDNGMIFLQASSPVISYRAMPDKKEFDPRDFILSRAESAASFDDTFSLWVEKNNDWWGRNISTQNDEDLVIAWLSQSLLNGNYRAAASVVPVAFGSGTERTWESAVYQFDRRIGVWERAVRAITASDRDTVNRITQLLSEDNFAIFNERNLIDFLAVREQDDLIAEYIDFFLSFNSTVLTSDISSGILESYVDFSNWLPNNPNPFISLAEESAVVAAQNLQIIGENVFFISGNTADIAFNIRLGMAVRSWGEKTGREDWAALGRSIILSVINLCDDDSSIPSSLQIGEEGNIIQSDAKISAAALYRLISNNEFLPRTISTGVEGLWTYTAAQDINITQNNRQMDISVSFPVGGTHYLMLRNIRPVSMLNIHNMDWRRSADFESYFDASGWFYFESEQTLVLKVAHRSSVEQIRIFF